MCSADWLRLGQITSSVLVCDLLFWAEGSAKVKLAVSETPLDSDPSTRNLPWAIMSDALQLGLVRALVRLPVTLKRAWEEGGGGGGVGGGNVGLFSE